MISSFLRAHPLLRFLAVNLGLGIVVALLAVGGLIALDIHGLRQLIAQDQSPVLALVLLAFGFIVTFGSWVMGTAIMALGDKPGASDPAPTAHAGAADNALPGEVDESREMPPAVTAR
jgi:hypothetical protein